MCVTGHDINLVKILITSETLDRRVVDYGDVAVTLKDSDARLNRSLTFPQFTTAFGVFRDIICEVTPDRRVELDNYLAIIADLATTYGGTGFYEYHRSFSAKAAMFIQRFNQRIDWSVQDLGLMSRHFSGRPALSCSICGAFTHVSDMCPKSASFTTISAPGKVNYKNPMPLCIKFNEAVCTFPNCKFVHSCSFCGQAHPKSVCPRRANPRAKNLAKKD